MHQRVHFPAKCGDLLKWVWSEWGRQALAFYGRSGFRRDSAILVVTFAKVLRGFVESRLHPLRAIGGSLLLPPLSASIGRPKVRETCFRYVRSLLAGVRCTSVVFASQLECHCCCLLNFANCCTGWSWAFPVAWWVVIHLTSFTFRA